MGYQEEMEIDLLDLCKYILKHWRLLLLACLTGVLVAGIATFFGVKKYHRELAQFEKLSQEQIELTDPAEEMVEEMDSEPVEPLSQSEFDDISVALNNYYGYKDILAKRMQYKEGSVLLNLDNSCVPTLERTYLISDYYEIEFPKVNEVNFIRNIIAMYSSAILNDKAIARIRESMGWDYGNLYINELINVDSVGDSILGIKVMAPSENDCRKIMAVVDDIVDESTANIKESFSFNFTYLSESYSEEYNDDITIKKKQLADDIFAMEKNIYGLPASLTENEKPIYWQAITDEAFAGKQLSYEDALKIQNAVAEEKALELVKASKNAVSKTEEDDDEKEELKPPVKPSSVKNGVLGVIGGLFIASCVLAVYYVLNGKLKVADDLARAFNCPVLEVIDDPDREFKESIFGKFDKMLDEALYHRKPYDDTLSLSASQVKLGMGGINASHVLLTNSYDSDCDDKPVMDLVAKVKSFGNSGEGFATEYVNRVIKNAMEIEKIGNMDCAVIIERLGESRYEDINKEIGLLKKSRIEVLGAVVIR